MEAQLLRGLDVPSLGSGGSSAAKRMRLDNERPTERRLVFEDFLGWLQCDPVLRHSPLLERAYLYLDDQQRARPTFVRFQIAQPPQPQPQPSMQAQQQQPPQQLPSQPPLQQQPPTQATAVQFPFSQPAPPQQSATAALPNSDAMAVVPPAASV
jgi:hypothetical protein